MKKFRIIQLITFIHYIHHIHFSYGWKIPFLNFAYFKNDGIKRIKVNQYHNSTLTGIY